MEVYNLKIKHSNSYELVNYFLSVYAALEGNKNHKLRPKLVEILSYYVLYGYNDDTKKLIVNIIPNMTLLNLNQINSELQRKGYLLKGVYKDSSRELNSTLKTIKKYIELPNKKMMVVSFEDEIQR